MANMAGTDIVIGGIAYTLDLDDSKFKGGLKSAAEENNKFASVLSKTSDKLKTGFQDAFSAIGTAITRGLEVGAVAAVGFGVMSVKAYGEAQAAQTMLEHAVVGVTKASKEQLKQTEELANTLEKKGVLDGDNIKVGLAQLSTFGLSNKAVQALGGSLADLAVNQFGVNASGEQLADSANMIAKALNNQFGVLEKSGIRFTDAQKHAIQFGTEMQKVKAINEGFAQNLKYTNETALNDYDGKLAHIKVALGNMQETIGGVIVKAITPMTDKLSAWASSPDVQKKVEEITQRMSDWVTNVAVPWIQTHWPAIKRVAEDVFTALKNGFNWLIDHQAVLVGVIAAIGAAWVWANPLALAIAAIMGVGGIGWLVDHKSGIEAAGVAIGVAWAWVNPWAAAIGLAVAGIKWIIDNIKEAKTPMTQAQIKATSDKYNLQTGAGLIPGKNALGTSFWKGGPTWVGERGEPELLDLPRGTKITPASKVNQGVTININTGNLIASDAELREFTRRLGMAAGEVFQLKGA